MAYAGKAGESRRLAPGSRSATRGSLTAAPKSSRPVGTLATGIAIGLMVGASVALLFAPQSGRETRYGLKRGFRRAGRRGRDTWDDLRDELRRARRHILLARRRRQVDLADDATVQP